MKGGLARIQKQNKLQWQLADVQMCMRLKVSGDKTEIQQSYVPALHVPLGQPLMDLGAVHQRVQCVLI